MSSASSSGKTAMAAAALGAAAALAGAGVSGVVQRETAADDRRTARQMHLFTERQRAYANLYSTAYALVTALGSGEVGSGLDSEYVAFVNAQGVVELIGGEEVVAAARALLVSTVTPRGVAFEAPEAQASKINSTLGPFMAAARTELRRFMGSD